MVMGGFRFQVEFFSWAGSGTISRVLLRMVFQLFQLFSGFFGLVEGILVGCCSDLFGFGRTSSGGLSRCARGVVALCAGVDGCSRAYRVVAGRGVDTGSAFQALMCSDGSVARQGRS